MKEWRIFAEVLAKEASIRRGVAEDQGATAVKQWGSTRTRQMSLTPDRNTTY